MEIADMTRLDQMRNRALTIWLFVLIAPVAAVAQDVTPTNPNAQGPMIVERLKSSFLVAPDFKVTEVDHKTSELAGAYAGWLTDNTLLIGAGGYWLANRPNDREMAYGGLVVGWRARTNHRLGFGAKALVGGGQATLSNTIIGIGEDSDDRNGQFGRGPSSPREHPVLQQTAPTRARFHDGFFIVDPEATLLVNLTHRLRLTSGMGYRLISGFSNGMLSNAGGCGRACRNA
ncbi:MAG: hypothetical protein DMF92_14530 [Acidobacteria bacterium]|nr:MAG: hypothetical protein DMF92_14530 [Acidobacteriota bacterium]